MWIKAFTFLKCHNCQLLSNLPHHKLGYSCCSSESVTHGGGITRPSRRAYTLYRSFKSNSDIPSFLSSPVNASRFDVSCSSVIIVNKPYKWNDNIAMFFLPNMNFCQVNKTSSLWAVLLTGLLVVRTMRMGWVSVVLKKNTDWLIGFGKHQCSEMHQSKTSVVCGML